MYQKTSDSWYYLWKTYSWHLKQKLVPSSIWGKEDYMPRARVYDSQYFLGCFEGCSALKPSYCFEESSLASSWWETALALGNWGMITWSSLNHLNLRKESWSAASDTKKLTAPEAAAAAFRQWWQPCQGQCSTATVTQPWNQAVTMLWPWLWLQLSTSPCFCPSIHLYLQPSCCHLPTIFPRISFLSCSSEPESVAITCN